MFFSGPDYRFHFEIVVVLVIALIIYVFMSIAWIVGQSLWRIQEKVNRHELTIADRDYVSQRCRCQRTSLAICSDDHCLQYGETGFERLRRFCKELDDKEDVRRTLKDSAEVFQKACNKVSDAAEILQKANDKNKQRPKHFDKEKIEEHGRGNIRGSIVVEVGIKEGGTVRVKKKELPNPSKDGQPPDSEKDGQPPDSEKDGKPPDSEKDGQPPNSEKDGQPPDLEKDRQPPDLEKDGQPSNLEKDGQPPNSEKDGQPSNLEKDGQPPNSEKDGQPSNLEKDGKPPVPVIETVGA